MPSEIAFEKKWFPMKQAKDWEHMIGDTWYSKSLDLYWSKGTHYCPLSASHNGLIGYGAKLKKVIKNDNI